MKSPAQRGSTLESAQLITTYLLREPVKDAVRASLREEGVVDGRTEELQSEHGSSGSGGPSKLAIGVVLVALGGLAYAVSRTRGSGGGWSSESESITRQTGGREPGSTGSATGGSRSSATTSEDASH